MAISRYLRATLISSMGCLAVVALILAGLWAASRSWGPSDNSALHGAAFLVLAVLPCPLLIAFVFPRAARLAGHSFQSSFLPFFAWSCGILVIVAVFSAIFVVWLLGARDINRDLIQLIGLFSLFALAVSLTLVAPWSYLWRRLARDA
jgi:hypothetical protein